MQIASGQPSRQQIRREASYQALIESAIRQFHERGYAATSINQIVEPTPYTAGAFYYHFKNKTDCFWHALAYRQAQRGDWYNLPERLDPHTTPLEELLEQVFAGFTETLEGLNVWMLVMADFYQQHQGHPEVQARLTQTYKRWHHELWQFITALQAGGWVNLGLDPDLLTTEAFAYQEGLAAHARIYSLDPQTFKRATIDGLLTLLQRPTLDR